MPACRSGGCFQNSSPPGHVPLIQSGCCLLIGLIRELLVQESFLCLILSGWESICASRRRGQCVCAQGLFPGQISSWHKGKRKVRGFPLDFGEIRLLPGNWRHLRKTAAAFSQKKTPEMLSFYTHKQIFFPAFSLEGKSLTAIPPL